MTSTPTTSSRGVFHENNHISGFVRLQNNIYCIRYKGNGGPSRIFLSDRWQP